MKRKIPDLFRFFAVCISIISCSLIIPDAAHSLSFPVPDKLHYRPLQFTLPKAERVVLENGIVLFILEDHELPLINVTALIKTGTIDDPAGKEGVAELTAYVMKTGGTKKLRSSDVDNQLDMLAASLSITAAPDFAQIDFSLLNKDIDQGLDLLSQMLITPAFEQEKLNLAKGLKIEELRRLKDDPQKFAVREFNRLFYSGNPYGRFPSVQSIKNIAREDLLKFHGQYFQPHNIMFAITGDITKEAAVNKIKQYCGDWQSRDSFVRQFVPPQNPPAGFFYIDKGIPQSTIISGRLAPSKNNSDFYAFTILDFIIGSGGFPSRIFSAVRNNAGLAYSAGSFYRARSGHGVFAAYAFTKTESTFQTLALIDATLANVLSDNISAGELTWAKSSIINGFLFSFTSPEQVARQQMKLEYDNLPSDFLVTYRQKIENIPIDEIYKVAVKYLDKKNVVTLILGDTKKLGRPLPDNSQPVLISPED
jgi:predicted Zn-dependent peptidase